MAEIEFLPPPRSSSDADSVQRVEPVPAAKVEAAGAAPPAIRFRPLTPDEITKFVAGDYAHAGAELPDPAISKIIGALQDDQVIAYLVLQLKLHAQPLVIRSGYQNVLSGLVHAAEAHILSTAGPQWVYLFTPAGKLTQLAASMGMALEPWCVMSKLVQPDLPAKPALALVPEPIPSTDEELEQYPGVEQQTIEPSREFDDSAWDSLFPNGIMSVDPSTGRVQ